MSKFYSKRGSCLYFNSYDLDHIFYGLKNGDSFNEIKDNFIFEMSLDPYLSSLMDRDEELIFRLPIFIPMHKKYIRFNNSFENFRELFNYMNQNSSDGNIIPFLGEDI